MGQGVSASTLDNDRGSARRPSDLGAHVRSERRRSALAVLGAAGTVFTLLVLGGALSLGLGLAAVAAVAAIGEVFLWAARVRVGPDADAAHSAGQPSAAAFEAHVDQEVLAAGQAVFDVWPDPALLIDRDERIVAANAAARAAFHIVSVPTRLATAMREPAVLTPVRETLADQRARASEFMLMAPQERHFRVLLAPVVPANAQMDAAVNPSPGRERPGGDGQALVVFHDTTAARRAERARLDFLANASHELRTPLTSVAGFIETLRGHARDDAQAQERFLAIMAGETARMRRLIDDLLSLSRAELNEHVPPTDVVDLAAVAGDVADGLGPVARAADVTVQVEGAAAIWVVGDRDQLVQIVQNLADNAVKYSAAGGAVTITVGLAPGPTAVEPARPEPGQPPRLTLVSAPDADAGFAWVAVRDRGAGIAREHLPRLGERFFRCDEPGSSGRGRDGTGLGLAIVKRLVSRHRGGLTVASSPDEGATFTVFAPRARAGAVDAANAASADAHASSGAVRGADRPS